MAAADRRADRRGVCGEGHGGVPGADGRARVRPRRHRRSRWAFVERVRRTSRLVHRSRTTGHRRSCRARCSAGAPDWRGHRSGRRLDPRCGHGCVFGDPSAHAFKRAVLEAGGFVPTRGPMPWTPEFWAQMRVMVFEPFWARFGSLGAGPFPGSRGLAALRGRVGVVGVARLLGNDRRVRGRVAAHPDRRPRRPTAARRAGLPALDVYALSVCGVGVCFGLAGVDWRQPGAAGRHGRALDAAPRPAAHRARGATRGRGSRTAATRARAGASTQERP